MDEIGKNGWLMNESGGNERESPQETMGKKPEQVPLKTVMVYWMDKKNMRKEPIGIPHAGRLVGGGGLRRNHSPNEWSTASPAWWDVSRF